MKLDLIAFALEMVRASMSLIGRVDELDTHLTGSVSKNVKRSHVSSSRFTLTSSY